MARHQRHAVWVESRASSGRPGARFACVVLALISIWAPAWCVSASRAGVVCRRVALTGDPVSGEPDGTTFTYFYFPSTYETPSINDQGRALFSAGVNTPAGYMRRLYIESATGVQRIAEVGQQAPGEPDGVTLQTFDWATANDIGEVAFVSLLFGPGTASDDRGVWRWDADGLHRVMRESTPVGSQMPGYTYSNYVSGFRYAGRYVGYQIGLTGPGYPGGEAIMAGLPDAVQPVAKYGDPAPGTAPETYFTRFFVEGSNWQYQMNDSGAVAFRATVQTGAKGIWAGGAGSLALVAAAGTPAPGVEPGAVFTSGFGEPGFNSAGDVGFWGYITGPGVGTNVTGVWVGKPNALRVVVRCNGPLPGFPAGYGLKYYTGWDPVVNAAGGVAFCARLRGPDVTTLNDSTVWSETASGLKMVAREGDAHPSLPAGVTFGSFVATPLTNVRGQVVFSSTLRGPGLPYPLNESLWLSDRYGMPHLVAWSGVPFEVAPGDFRTVSSFVWTVNSGGGGQDGRRCGLNDRGELVFEASFQDGSQGVFVASIEEPPVQCDAGGPYTAECAGAATTIALDGTASSAADGSPLTYAWTTTCPGAAFDDPTSPTPTLTVDASAGCNLNCSVTLTVSDGVHPAVSCEATVSVSDTAAPSITCPADVTVNAGEPTDPSATGSAAATDACDPAPGVSYTDVETPSAEPAGAALKTISRTWTATDACGLTASCVQTITVLKRAAGLDIRPWSCPNPLNLRSRGRLPAALLGAGDFDVAAVDIATLRLMRADGVGDAVAPLNGPPGPHPIRWDVGTPSGGAPCACHAIGGDGIVDLLLRFSTPDLVSALQLSGLQRRASVELVLTGSLADGTPFRAVDCVRIVGRGDSDADDDVDLEDFGRFSSCFNGPNHSPLPATDCDWADADEDGDVDMADFGAFAECFNGPNRPSACK